MTKYLQFNPAMIDANGLVPISAEVVSTGIAAPNTPNQIAVEDDVDTFGMVIDTALGMLVANPDVLVPAGGQGGVGVVTVDVDMSAEYQKVIADENYFLANFVKIG